jgi:hypothetical protein
MSRASARSPEPEQPKLPQPAVMSEALDSFEDPAFLGGDPGDQPDAPLEMGPPPPDELEYHENTIFWHMEGDLETPLAVLWVNTKYPNSRARVVSELLIPRLNETNSLIILSRPQARLFPLINVIVNPSTGYRTHDVVNPYERLDSVKRSPAISLAPFISGASRYAIGKFDSNRFFDVCANHMSGRMRVQEKEMTIRYLPG